MNELSRQREVTRTKRKDSGYTLVSLAGYTNAGKSALMNKMCGAEVEVDNRLFSTLSTTTRKIKSINGNVLMSDTVGFIRNLPPDLVNAFNSTLEEIFYADLILLMFDSSETLEVIESKLKVSMEILLPKVEGRSLLVLGNKTDLINDESRNRIRLAISALVSPYELLFVSAVTGEGLDPLREKIAVVQGRTWSIVARLPLTDPVFSLLSRLRSIASVSSAIVGASVEADIRCRPVDAAKIIGWLEGASAKISSSKTVLGEHPQGEFLTPLEEKGAPSGETTR